VSTIPEYYVKHVFVKYISLKETVGEYILKSVHQGEDIYGLLLEAEESKSNDKNSQKGFFGKLIQKFDEVAGTSSNIKPNIQRSSTQIVGPPKTEIQTNENHSRTSINTQDSEQYKSEDDRTSSKEETFESASTQTSPVKISNSSIPNFLAPYMDIPTGRDVFISLCQEDPYYTFIPCNSILNQKEDKKLLLAKASHYIEDMIKHMIKKKNALADNKDLLVMLLQNYVKILIHSKVLIQEAKVL
jgi:hypothetical protein